jgi:hypothetical protein
MMAVPRMSQTTGRFHSDHQDPKQHADDDHHNRAQNDQSLTHCGTHRRESRQGRVSLSEQDQEVHVPQEFFRPRPAGAFRDPWREGELKIKNAKLKNPPQSHPSELGAFLIWNFEFSISRLRLAIESARPS